MLSVYYKFVMLPDEVKANHKIKSPARLDCISCTDNTNTGYNGLNAFKTTKNQLVLRKQEAKRVIKTDSKRIAEWVLGGGVSLNFSSIYVNDIDSPEYGYGYPNAHKTVGKAKKPNPLYDFRNDAYLFILNKDYSEIEIIVIPDGRNLITQYYHVLIDGGYDELIKELRKKANFYFEYKGL